MTGMILPTASLDMFVRWEPLLGNRASFLSGLDNDTGTIRMVGGGVWRPADAHRYFDHQRPIIEQARRRFGPLKILMDVRGWVVENPDSVSQFQDINTELFDPEDRLAAVVQTSANKQHSRDAIAVGIREAFVSPSAAETWLHAYSSGPASRRQEASLR